MRIATTRAGAALCVAAALLALTGCYGEIEYTSPETRANEEACGGTDCHADQVTDASTGAHREAACTICHEGTGDAHSQDPKKAVATTDWTIDGCASCHEGEAETYLYDDNAQVGPFGGSQRTPAQPKVKTFPEYNTIVAGHAFAKDYNEEGAHAFMLADHRATTRGKFETCVQCKSSKVAYAWKEGKPITVAKTMGVVLTHTAADGKPAKTVTIPAGTKLTYKTDPESRAVNAEATFPDGTRYTSKPSASEDATKSYNMVWASTIAAIQDTMPYGAGCNHCHDPHTGEARVLRQSMIQSFEGKGGIKGAGGVNPYVEGSPKAFETASSQDKQVLACAQCHVEYTCGKSGVDKIDRDAFGWSKAADLHDLYTTQFDYKQDFVQKIIGEPLIKSQHPETELFWNSVHYDAGATCSSCHMPDVIRNGKTIKSHWFTSPYKYADAKLWSEFVASTGLKATSPSNPCTRCHADRIDRAIAQQRSFFSAQAKVEKLLAQSVKNLGALKTAKKNTGADYRIALEAHRRAHSVWENLAVSENSMGFHNYEESMSSMAEAERQIKIAIAKEKVAAK